MKTRITRKEAKSWFGNRIYSCGQADSYLDSLLGSPDFYFTRVEGWACDAWVFGNCLLTAGYASFGKEIAFYDYVVGWYDKYRKSDDVKSLRRRFKLSLKNFLGKSN